jgi:hypothetical protein
MPGQLVRNLRVTLLVILLVDLLAARLEGAVVARAIVVNWASYVAARDCGKMALGRALRVVLLDCGRMARVTACLIHYGILRDVMDIVLESFGCMPLALVDDTVVVAATSALVGTAAPGSILVELDSSVG